MRMFFVTIEMNGQKTNDIKSIVQLLNIIELLTIKADYDNL